jgi:hypothetical protein
MMVYNRHFLWTLEDVVRTRKIANQTAIWADVYELTITWSNRFKRRMPLIMGVRDFTGIRIHDGTTAANTDGCVLVGSEKGKDCLIENKQTFFYFYTWLHDTLQREKVFLEIKNYT